MNLIISALAFLAACISVSLFLYSLDKAHGEVVELVRENLSPGALARKARMIW